MKTYSKLLNRSTMFCASVLMFWSTNVEASLNSVEVPNSNEISEIEGLPSSPPSGLYIVSLSPYEYSAGIHIRCNGQNSGRATVVAAGGVAPYTYQWSGLPGQTGATALGMFAGTYTVTVTDAVGNAVSESVTLVENPPLQAVPVVSPILCNGGVATITMTATGGTAPYSGLNWYNAIPGNYYYTIADAHGCRDRAEVEITEPPLLEATATVTAPIQCNGGSTAVLVEGFGGTGPYNATGLYNASAGTANYTITDANGCYGYATVAIDEPAPLIMDVTFPGIACRGGDTDVTVSCDGGTAPYSGPGVYSQVSAGNYQYTVIDANGCQSTTPVQITQPAALVASISSTPVACNGDLSAIEVVATGGTSPYTGPGTYYEQAGFHSYNVTDANGCSVDIATIVEEPQAIVLDVTLSPFASESGETIIDIQATGGTPSYMGTGLVQAAPGTYVFTVTDANGCVGSETVIVPDVAAVSTGLMNEGGNKNGSLKTDGSANDQSFTHASFNVENEQTEVTYQLMYDSQVRIELYDMTGALVGLFEERGAKEGQNYSVVIESGKLRTGVYTYHLVTNRERRIDKLQIVK